MNTVIYKYPLTPNGIITVPEGTIRLVAEQGGMPYVWIERDPTVAQYTDGMITLVTFPTGFAFSSENLLYIGSSIGSSPYVWHVYRRLLIPQEKADD